MVSSPNLIRVGFIGLSKSSWADVGHAPYLLATDKYRIVALCNRSVQNAQKAVKDFNLPDSTKTYGDPQDLANDPDVDLVVCSVRVDHHFPTIRPSLVAGKSVYVEWPLGKDLAEAEELLRLSVALNVENAFVCAQDVASPITQKVKALLSEGRIGRILSSTLMGQVVFLDLQAVPESHGYLFDAKVGGNFLTILVAHMIAYIQRALGETLEIASSLLTNRTPSVRIAKADGTSIPVEKDTHDHIMFLAQTSESKAPFSFSLRGGQAFTGTPGLEWRIYGEKGEIRVTAPHGTLNNGLDGTSLTIHDFDTKELVEVSLDDEFANLPPTARDIARTYEAISEGDRSNLLTFKQAVQIHKLTDQLLRANVL